MKIFLIITFFIVNSYSWSNFNVGVNTSVINGTSKEIVYSSGRKLSELTWRLDNVPLSGAGFNINYNKSIYFQYSFLNNMTNPTSTMDDYDWLLSNSTEWTHHSNHPNTIVDDVNLSTFNIGFNITNSETFTSNFLYCFRSDYFKWHSLGGTYVYSSSDGSNFREYTGSFAADETGITYTQSFTSSYLGLELIYKISSLSLYTKFGYGTAQASDIDIHHLRNLYFTEEFEDVPLTFLDLNAEYNVAKYISIIASASYVEYKTTVGNTTILDMSSGRTYYSIQSAGISHKSQKINIGINIIFN